MKGWLKQVFGFDPLNTTHELEMLRITELDALQNIDKFGKEMAQRYLDGRFLEAKNLALLTSKAYSDFIIAIERANECRARIVHEREAPKSQKFDYAGCDPHTY